MPFWTEVAAIVVALLIVEAVMSTVRSVAAMVRLGKGTSADTDTNTDQR